VNAKELLIHVPFNQFLSSYCSLTVCVYNSSQNIEGWSDLNTDEDVSKLRESRSTCIELSDDELSDDESACTMQDTTNTDKQQRKTTCWKIMTFENFVKEAWTKIQKLDPMYQPSLVWTEIVSFIKGSYEALNSPNGYLSLEEYEQLGRKMAPMFTGKRRKIYEMFLKYEHFKKQQFFIDEADITRNMYFKYVFFSFYTPVFRQDVL
jgi:hypothetical protein